MRPTAMFVRMVATALCLMAALGSSGSALPDAAPNVVAKLDSVLQQHANARSGWSRVIIRLPYGGRHDAIVAALRRLGGLPGRKLPIINGCVADVPNALLAALAASPLVEHVSLDRQVGGSAERTGATTGATAARQAYGYDGRGVGVAVIDSGITSWHDDLTAATGAGQRIERFVDLVNGRQVPYDDHGHGTHVAGIVAGNGFDSAGGRSGGAPAADLIVFKVLDGSGTGRVSDVIAAIEFIVEHRVELNIRVVNLSLTAAAYESYDDDPLTRAARRAVEAGIVVVAAAGNAGRSPKGQTQYGSVLAPGNAPWVLTVGASSHGGTVLRGDDSIAPFSSRGPGVGGDTYSAKPDLVAPGVGIESLSDPSSAFYTSRAPYLLRGVVPTPFLPYLSLSGTSMATAVVSGTIALMLHANPALTPNQVKAILQYTAQRYPLYDPLTQGAGFLNAKGAVDLAHYFAAPSSRPMPTSADWGRRLIWGNRLVEGGRLTPNANAWATSVMWGEATTHGDSVTWGVICSSPTCDTATTAATPWSISSPGRNVVWGSLCGGNDCQQAWRISSVVAADADAVVWGVNEGDAVVWGVDGEAVVWGVNGDAVVWGVSCADPSCEPVLWSGR